LVKILNPVTGVIFKIREAEVVEFYWVTYGHLPKNQKFSAFCGKSSSEKLFKKISMNTSKWTQKAKKQYLLI